MIPTLQLGGLGRAAAPAAGGGGGPDLSALRFDSTAIGDGMTLSMDNARCTCASATSTGAGVVGEISGKRYLEFLVVSLGTTIPGFGLATAATRTADPFNAGKWGMTKGSGCGVSAGLFINGSPSGNGAYAFGAGDVIGVAFDDNAGKLWFRKNGTWIVGDPAAGTSPSITIAPGAYYFYFGAYKCSGSGAIVADVRVASAEFSSAAPAGFSSHSGL